MRLGVTSTLCRSPLNPLLHQYPRNIQLNDRPELRLGLLKRPAELIGFQSLDVAEHDLLHLREVRLDADGAYDFEDLTDSAARNRMLTRASSRFVLEWMLSARLRRHGSCEHPEQK